MKTYNKLVRDRIPQLIVEGWSKAVHAVFERLGVHGRTQEETPRRSLGIC
ncbi:MAG: hypothetical protein MZU97_05560 [Bacillus subtilis]|nr:hypothetical protein [Bacillus subtilis]